jgi:hypothetical protein
MRFPMLMLPLLCTSLAGGCATYRHGVVGGPVTVVEGQEVRSLQIVPITKNYIMTGSPVLFLVDDVPRTDWQYARMYNDSPTHRRDAIGMLSMANSWTRSIEPALFRYVIGTRPFVVAMGERPDRPSRFGATNADFVFADEGNPLVSTVVVFSADQFDRNVGRSTPSHPDRIETFAEPVPIRTVIRQRQWDHQEGG